MSCMKLSNHINYFTEKISHIFRDIFFVIHQFNSKTYLAVAHGENIGQGSAAHGSAIFFIYTIL